MEPGKRLVLVRHAKSSWEHQGLFDEQRPLAPRGIRTAPAVARELARRGWAPDVVVCSNAVRALQTWERMQPELPPAQLIPSPALYMGETDDVLAAVARLSDEHRTVWLVGHNPAWEIAAEELCGYEGPVKTADAVLMTSGARSWSAATEGAWDFVDRIAGRSVAPGR